MRCTLEFPRQSNTAALDTLVELAQSTRNAHSGNAMCGKEPKSIYSKEITALPSLTLKEMSLCLFDDINWSKLRIEITQAGFRK